MGRITPFLDDIAVFLLLLFVIGVASPEWLPWLLLIAAGWFLGKLWLFRSHLRAPAVGVEAMTDRVATALEDLTPTGQVELDGEIWSAQATEPAAKGEHVRVLRVEGLTLHVAPTGVVGGPPPRVPPDSVLLGIAKRLKRS